MLPKFLITIPCLLITVLLLMFADVTQAGPVPIVNEHQQLMPKVPQWHCLRYFKHDVLMMRRCRHLRVPTAPRLGDVLKRKRRNNGKLE